MLRKRLVVAAIVTIAVAVSLVVFYLYRQSNDDLGPPTSARTSTTATTPTPSSEATPKPEPSPIPKPEPKPKPKPKPTPEYPADVLNLSNWKLTLPIGPSHHEAREIEQPALATYRDPRFFDAKKNGSGVVFRAPAGGATTSGSDYPRSELREMADRGRKEASWSNRSGRHVMTLTEAITEVPKVKRHVVAGQIHDSEDDVVMIRLERKRLFVEADGDDVGLLDGNYVLGTKFTVKIIATPAGIAIRYNGSRLVRYNKVGSGLYFKAGCYTQSNKSRGDAPDASGKVVIYKLKVSHS